MPLALSPYGEQQPETQYGSQPQPKPRLTLATGTATGPNDPYATTADSSAGGNYLGQTIQPGPQTDRVALAEHAFDTFARSSDPVYQKTLRDAEAAGAATGRLGSGQLRTSLGDAAANRQLQLDTARDQLITQATSDAINDQYRNIEIAQQQQGFQAGQQQTAYSQALAKAQQDLAAELGRGNLNVQTGQLTGTINGQQTLGARAQTLAETTSLRNLSQQDRQIALAERAQQANEAYQNHQITLAERDQVLRELQNAQQNTIATGQLQLQRDQLAETARQFGLSQAQQLHLAQLSDATANRQIDVQTSQGRQQLLVSLGNILGGASGTIPPQLLQTILQALGVHYDPTTGNTTPLTTYDPTYHPPGGNDTTDDQPPTDTSA